MDIRRERLGIRRRHDEYARLIGQNVLWACFNPTLSTMDNIYDEPGDGYRRYFPPVKIPVLWVNKIEGNIDYNSDRLDTADAYRLALSKRQAASAGVRDVDNDDQRIHDIFRYRNQWWQVNEWEILGRYGYDDVIIGVRGVEGLPEKDYVFEPSFPS